MTRRAALAITAAQPRMIAALAICRLLHDGAVLQAFGACWFWRVLMPSELQRAAGPPMRRLIGAAILLAGATTPLWLGLMAIAMTEDWQAPLDPATLETVTFETSFGQVWLGHAALAALLCGAFVLPGGRGSAMLLPLSAALLASLGLVGHAVGPPGPLGWLHRANHAVHLLASGAWIGSLLPLLAVLRWLSVPALAKDCATSLRRFSQFGHAAVAVVLMTGFANIMLILGQIPAFTATPYRLLLLTKIALVLVMVCFALYNRYWLVEELRAEPVRSLALLRLNTIAGVGLAGLVLAVTSVLGLVEPL